jgi:nitrogen fixation protein NifB
MGCKCPNIQISKQIPQDILEEPVQKSSDARRDEHPSEGVLGSYVERGRAVVSAEDLAASAAQNSGLPLAGATQMGVYQQALEKTQKHPCYSADAHHKHARMHLPVAPSCNIQCNYCNRKFDCVHESRPGVTSEVLTPETAKQKFAWVKDTIENLSVVGIAGPGDALGNWENTKETIQAIKKISPDTVFCLSTNGLMLPEYAQEIVDLGIHHVTVTVNTLDPEIGAKIYQHVYYQGRRYTGAPGAHILIENQLKGIEELTKRWVLVKVNIVMIKDINDRHIPEVVKKAKELGAFMSNIMPLIPAPGSAFENFPQTSAKEVNEMRNACQIDLTQMRHCRQCRADAIGMLDHDRSQEFRMCNRNAAPEQPPITRKEYIIAVASKHGRLVDQHFGHASEFFIYKGDGQKFTLTEMRKVDKYCTGMEECEPEETRRDAMITALQDCDAVVTMRIGYHAKERLQKKGIRSMESCDTVENGLQFAVEQLALKQAM